MDFWKVYLKKSHMPEFGTGQLWLKTGERWNTSILRYLEYSYTLETGGYICATWNPESRYLIAKEIISDLFVSFYDVNSRTVYAARLSGNADKFLPEISTARKHMADPNIEMRVIGLQNSGIPATDSIGSMRNAMGTGSLVEADLFGNQKRHIIMDLYTGKVYNLLLENRIYRPGELVVALPGQGSNVSATPTPGPILPESK